MPLYDKARKACNDDSKLIAIQKEIEAITLEFDVGSSLYKSISELDSRLHKYSFCKEAQKRLMNMRVGDKNVLVNSVAELDGCDRELCA